MPKLSQRQRPDLPPAFFEDNVAQTTLNLLFASKYCKHWGTHDGTRELLQNFFDGVSSAYDIKRADVSYDHTVLGGSHHSEFVERWEAKSCRKRDQGCILGEIEYDRKAHTFTITVSQPSVYPGLFHHKCHPDILRRLTSHRFLNSCF